MYIIEKVHTSWANVRVYMRYIRQEYLQDFQDILIAYMAIYIAKKPNKMFVSNAIYEL
jgi:hypothetical protein